MLTIVDAECTRPSLRNVIASTLIDAPVVSTTTTRRKRRRRRTAHIDCRTFPTSCPAPDVNRSKQHWSAKGKKKCYTWIDLFQFLCYHLLSLKYSKSRPSHFKLESIGVKRTRRCGSNVALCTELTRRATARWGGGRPTEETETRNSYTRLCVSVFFTSNTWTRLTASNRWFFFSTSSDSRFFSRTDWIGNFDGFSLATFGNERAYEKKKRGRNRYQQPGFPVFHPVCLSSRWSGWSCALGGRGDAHTR